MKGACRSINDFIKSDYKKAKAEFGIGLSAQPFIITGLSAKSLKSKKLINS